MAIEGTRRVVGNMFSAGAIGLYGLLAVGYIAMIVTTERSAAHYVNGEIATKPRAEVVVPVAPLSVAVAKAPAVVSTHRALRTTRPAL